MPYEVEKYDFLTRLIPALTRVDLTDRDLIKQLEIKNPYYLIRLYNTRNYYKKALRLIRKFIRKGIRSSASLEQFFYVCCLYEDWKLLNTNMILYTKLVSRDLTKFRMFYRLYATVGTDASVVPYNYAVLPIYERIKNKIYDFTYNDLLLQKDNLSIPCGVDESAFSYTYLIKCNSEQWNSVMSELKTFLTKQFDINILFLYYYISSTSCILNECHDACSQMSHEGIRQMLLNEEYISRLGNDHLNFIRTFYVSDVQSKSDQLHTVHSCPNIAAKFREEIQTEDIYKKKHKTVFLVNRHTKKKDIKFINFNGTKFTKRIVDRVFKNHAVRDYKDIFANEYKHK